MQTLILIAAYVLLIRTAQWFVERGYVDPREITIAPPVPGEHGSRQDLRDASDNPPRPAARRVRA
jgi:hypothetical protein